MAVRWLVAVTLVVGACGGDSRTPTEMLQDVADDVGFEIRSEIDDNEIRNLCAVINQARDDGATVTAIVDELMSDPDAEGTPVEAAYVLGLVADVCPKL